MNDFLRNMVEQIKDEDTSIASDGVGASEYSGCVDTGCYILNAVLSGSIYGGVPNNKITGFAGETTTGKTFFVLSIMKSFLESNPDAGVVFYDTEAAVTKEMMESRGLDTARIIIAEPATIQQFRHHALRMIEIFEKTPEKKRPPLMFVLDSLGMLSTTKEMEDTLEGKETKDMTAAQIVKATFRVLTLKLAKAKIPFLVTNHTYAVVGSMYPTQEIAKGSGFKYAASTIAMLSKAKDKEGTEVVGNLIRIKMYKSRLSKENSQVQVKLSYRNGLDKYFGLLDLAEVGGIFKKVSTRYELPDGTKQFGKTINANPEKYYTKEILDKLDEVAKRLFSYGGNPEDADAPAIELDSTEEV